MNVRTFDNDTNGLIDQEVTYGCLSGGFSALVQCNTNLSGTKRPQKIVCCKDEDNCNKKLPIPWFNASFMNGKFCQNLYT